MQGWTSQQTCVFLEQLDSLAVEAKSVSGRAGVLPVDLLTALDAAYSLSERRNSEIKFRWLGLCLKAGLSSAVPKTVAFLSEQGRMKFVRPLFRALAAFQAINEPETSLSTAKAFAVKTFEDIGHIYHPITRKMVATDLGLLSAECSGGSTADKTDRSTRWPLVVAAVAVATGVAIVLLRAKLSRR